MLGDLLPPGWSATEVESDGGISWTATPLHDNPDRAIAVLAIWESRTLKVVDITRQAAPPIPVALASWVADRLAAGRARLLARTHG